jgi:hypothetical protein
VCLQGRYFEAVCNKIDPVNKEITACFPGKQQDCFTLPYDMLVVGVSGRRLPACLCGPVVICAF